MKKLALTGGFLVILGLVIFFVTAAFLGWDFQKFSTAPPLEETETSFQNKNQTLYIQDQNVGISVGASHDKDIHLIYFESDEQYYDIDESDNQIEIKKVVNLRWVDHIFAFDFHVSSPRLTILLPRDYTGNLEVTNSNSSVRLDGISLSRLTVKNSNGSIKLNQVNAMEDVDLKTSNSSLLVENSQFSHSLICQNANGSITLDDLRANDVIAKSANGRILAEDTSCAVDLSLETTNAGISVDEIKVGGNILLENQNGSIKGSIDGNQRDFSIRSHATNASNNLPTESSGGRKQLDVTTTNASIHLVFDD